jgi:hypothetical protein
MLPRFRLSNFRRPSRRTLLIAAGALIIVLPLLAIVGHVLAHVTIAGRLRRMAAARGLTASWTSLKLDWPLHVRVRNLALVDRAAADTVFAAESLEVVIDPFSALILHPEPRRMALAHARLERTRASSAAPDTTIEEPEAEPTRAGAARVRDAAEALARVVLAPARNLPELRLRDLTVRAPGAEDDDTDAASSRRLDIASLDLAHTREGIALAAAGRLRINRDQPFALQLEYAHDDALSGGAWLGVPDTVRGRIDTLRVRVLGRATQDRRRQELRVANGTRVWIGSLPITVSGSVSRRGPAVSLDLSADKITEDRIRASIPRAMLGPLTELSVKGSFDYRLAFQLNVARPDSVDLAVDVIPHGLQIDPARTHLRLLGLDQPFTATIHLPRGRIATRDLSPANPTYRPLDAIDSTLTHAVLTNEDGGFFRHRGFNLEAVKQAISANLRAGAYKRGAGTITMQLVRNLYLGHQRTLSRKAQEVVLAWVLEHLTGLSKERLLEIYMNIIEWGPDVHGAGEATRYYFGEDPGQISVDEALFMTTVVPSPLKWKYRFGKDGTLRPAERAQMHFIGRAMVGKGWLDPARLPDKDSLNVTLRGPARFVLFPDSSLVDSTRADSTGMRGGAAPIIPPVGPHPAPAR